MALLSKVNGLMTSRRVWASKRWQMVANIKVCTQEVKEAVKESLFGKMAQNTKANGQTTR